MHLPIPIDLRKKLECPFCHRLTPVCETHCQHCDQRIPEDFRERERLRLEKLRKRHIKQAWIILPLLLILLMMLFQPFADRSSSGAIPLPGGIGLAEFEQAAAMAQWKPATASPRFLRN